MRLYWVSSIIQDDYNPKPWLCAMSQGELDFTKAKETIAFLRRHHKVLSAWIDVFDENNIKQTVFHECYIDAFGGLS